MAREDERESERLGRVGGDCEGVELDEKERREGEGGVEDEAVLIINVLNSPVMPQK